MTSNTKPVHLKSKGQYRKKKITPADRKKVLSLNEINARKQKRTENQELLKHMCFFDDELVTAAFHDNIDAAQEVLNVILPTEKIEVVSVVVQKHMPNMYGKSARFDILVIDKYDRQCDLEVQRAEDGADARRTRYNSALMDSNLLNPSEDTKTLPDKYVIFITESDVWGDGLPVHKFKYFDVDTYMPLGDGSCIIYVNGAYKGLDPIGLLVADFHATDPSQMHYKSLREAMDRIKNTVRGQIKMGKVMATVFMRGKNEGHKEGLEEGIVKGKAEGFELGRIETIEQNIRGCYKAGLSIELISSALGCPVEIVNSVVHKM